MNKKSNFEVNLQELHWRAYAYSTPIGETSTFKQAIECLIKDATRRAAGLDLDIETLRVNRNICIVSLCNNERPIPAPVIFNLGLELGVITGDQAAIVPWRVTIGNDIGKRPTFKDACQLMMEEILQRIQTRTMPWSLLETATWLELAKPTNLPIYFYDAKDIACEEGWIAEGNWVG